MIGHIVPEAAERLPEEGREKLITHPLTDSLDGGWKFGII